VAYEWDATKNLGNIAKHGVDFADAVAVFEDDLALTRPDPDARGEHRFLTLGVDPFGCHLSSCSQSGPRVFASSLRGLPRSRSKAYETGI